MIYFCWRWTACEVPCGRLDPLLWTTTATTIMSATTAANSESTSNWCGRLKRDYKNEPIESRETIHQE